jgi:membrane protein implicated in regulation of membrane protease activity
MIIQAVEYYRVKFDGNIWHMICNDDKAKGGYDE